MPPDALFRIYSMTKPVTCVAFMMLVEEGRIGLADPVSRYIPAWSEFRLLDGTVCRPMRVVDLLSHTSGLTYGIQYRTEIDARYRNALSMRSDGQTLEEFVAVLGKLPLEFEPGTAWNYSVATDVLGHLIERITGQSLDEFFQARILGPLGMRDTGFFVHPCERHRLADMYVRRSGEPLGLPGRSFENVAGAKPSFLSGGGGLISTVRDYLRFCRALLHPGEGSSVRLLLPETLRQMSMNRLPAGQDLQTASRGLFSGSGHRGIGFGLGWATTLDQAKAASPGNPGDLFWSGMANTFFWCDPCEDLICVFMTQLLPSETYPLQRELKQQIYRALGESHPRPSAPGASHLAACAVP
jgi:CubicO group peptidase (beta-lactamase class C family)